MENLSSLFEMQGADTGNREPSTTTPCPECSCTRYYCSVELRNFNTQRLFHVIGKKQSEQDIIDDIDACLKNGANINAQDDKGSTVLDIADLLDYQSVVEYLLANGGIRRVVEAHVDTSTPPSTTALFNVIGKKQSEQDIIDDIDACLKNGANINAQDDKGSTVLDMADLQNYQSVVEYLLEKGGIRRVVEAHVDTPTPPSPTALDSTRSFEADLEQCNTTRLPDEPNKSDVNTNTNPVELNSVVFHSNFTELTYDKNLTFSSKNYIDLLKTVTKCGHSINEKLNLDPYPSDRTLALLALKAYSDNPSDGTQQDLPEGWELLTTASNPSWSSGYFGVAFWCRALQQVVVAHRGTKVTNTGAMWTNVKSVIWTKETSHVCSAVTFTDAIATALNAAKAEGVSFQLSITGHSLGGWLAQVTAFTVKYLQKKDSTFRKMTNIKDGFHAHTVVFDSPGCRSMLSKMREKFDLRYERSIFLGRLDISCFLSAPNRINCLNLHVGRVYRVKTDLSDLSALDEFTLGYTTKTHSMKKMQEALETPDIVEMLDWPLRSVICGKEYNNFFKEATREKDFHRQTNRYEYRELNKNCSTLRTFTEDELLLLDSWAILKKSKMNLTNLIKINDLTVSDLFDEFEIDKEKQIVTCLSEDSVKKVIRHTKALMRWIPAEMMSATRQQVTLLPSAAEAMFRAERDNYLRSLKQSRLDFRDTIELEAFLISGSNILIIRTSDCEMEMTRFVNIFQQLQKKWELPEETINHYSFMDLKIIKRLETAVNIKELFKSCFTEDYLYIIQCTEYDDKNYENILNEILTNLRNNTNKLVFIASHDTDFEHLVKSFYGSQDNDNILKLKHTEEIALNDLTEKSIETLFEQKIILLQGERISLRNFVGDYRQLTPGELHDINTLIGSQMLKNLLTVENNITEMEEIFLNHDDLQVHSTLNMEVSMARVARVLREHAQDALLVISDIGEEELATERWKEFVHSLGKGKIFTTTREGETIFKKKCREEPCATIYWFSASAGLLHCKAVYKKEFYIKRKFVTSKYIFNIDKFVKTTDKMENVMQNALFVFRNVKIRQSDFVKTVVSDDKADDIIEECADRPVYLLKKRDAKGPILWQRSRGSLEYLRPYVSANVSGSISEEDLCNAMPNAVIIADEPGMGKSTSLTSISRQLRSAWVIRIDLKHFQIQNLPTELCLNSVSEFILADQSGWQRSLLQYCLNKDHKNSRKTYIFFDGFDEIKRDFSPTKNCAEDAVIRLLKFLNDETTARVWVTTRLYRKEILENAFSDFAMQFERISESQQREYLVRFWRPHLILEMDSYGDAEGRELEKCAEYLYGKAKTVLGDDIQKFMGIPLQMRMLAEVFMQRAKVFIESKTDIENAFDVKSVLDLYQRFSCLKYEIYLSDKTGLSAGMSEEIKISNVELITEKHRMLALRTLFPEFAEEHFDRPEDGWGAELCRVGLVQSSGGGRENIEFIHRTLAEYYCADLVVDWLRKKGRYHGHAPIAELLMSEILQRDSHKVIRVFVNNLVLSRPFSEDVEKFSALKISELWPGKQHVFFNQNQKTALHVAVEEGNTVIIDLLVGGFKCEPVRLISFMAAHDRGRETVLGRAVQLTEDHKFSETSKEIMKKIVQSLESCPYEVILELLLATYIKCTSIYGFDIKILTDYLRIETDCFQIKRALNRIAVIIQDVIPRFLIAVRNSRVKDVNELFCKMENDTERYYMLLARNAKGDTALHIAARVKQDEPHDKKQIIVILCNHNIPEVGRLYNDEGLTPLHLVAATGHLEMTEHLITHVAYIDSLSSLRGETALFMAAQSGSLPLVKRLVEIGSDINILNKDDENILFAAARGDSLPVMAYLVEKGLNINIVNKDGENVLFIAARSTSLLVMEYLVEKGSNINLVNKDGENALFTAVRTDCYLGVEYLAEKGSDVNILNKVRENVLFLAVRDENIPVIKYLLKRGSDVNIINNDGENVLFAAVQIKSLEVVEDLIEKGSNINIINKNGENALFHAARSESFPVIEYLVKKGSDLNILNKDGENVLFTAARGTSLLAVEYLVQTGSNINILNKDGENVLFAAARSKSLPLVKYLVEIGSDINILNDDGESVLFPAARSKSLPVVQYLVEKGLDVHIVNKKGDNILLHANEWDNQPVANFLLESMSPHRE